MQLIESIDDIREEIWRSLLDAAENKGQAFRYPIIATLSDSTPLQRVVVLRRVFVSNKTLLFHTDARSRKIDDLKTNPHLSWLFFDTTRRIQLHIHTKAMIHDPGSEMHENEWNTAGIPERLIYCVNKPPGTPVKTPDDIWPDGITKSPQSADDVSHGKSRFRVVTAEMESMDWLQLHAENIYRAKFTWGDDGWQGTWVCP